MGYIWRIMPLLSTLAALVIIVHSAEEDLDRDRRYDLRPRTIDTGTPILDQPWREVGVDAVPHDTTPSDTWHDSPEEPVKHRRPLRKRKRRPLLDEDYAPEERHTTAYTEDSPQQHENDYTVATTEPSRRRRKKPENRRNRWAEEFLDTGRPTRRRAQRRKRPSLENRPLLSEFNEYRSDENPPEVARTEQNDPLSVGDNIHFNNERREYDNEDWFASQSQPKLDIPQLEPMDPYIQATLEVQDDKVQMKEDKSLSDFSMEVLSPIHITENDEDAAKLGRKLKEKSLAMDELYKAKENGVIDPITLKDILKRSNGTSLSEILQQHNLSLADLLHGRESAISVLKSGDSIENQRTIHVDKTNISGFKDNVEINSDDKENVDDIVTAEPKVEIESTTEVPMVKEDTQNNKTETTVLVKHGANNSNIEKENRKSDETLEVKENSPQILSKRRYVGNIRRKLRMRPMMNSTVPVMKSQLNRDLIAMTARKYSHHTGRNITKSKEWRNVMPVITNVSETYDKNSIKQLIEIPTTTATTLEDTTVVQNSEYNNPSTIMTDIEIDDRSKQDEVELNNEATEISTTVTSMETSAGEAMNITEIPVTVRNSRPAVNRVGLRRQAFNNRLKRKRQKQRNSTTEPPVEQEGFMKDLFGMPNIVSSSEFIARTQTPNPPKTTAPVDDVTALDDFMTEAPKKIENLIPTSKIINNIPSTTPKLVSTTEETAKYEIEEILNDTRTSARLSKILMERNMTLNELVEHRERGSSHVHLADIFHNASREPNPPEPFLSKSLIEPISRETYPLRALLEANLHDPSVRATTIEPSQTQSFVNIPVVMDFGNNVNERGENMGIMSLFNKITGNDESVEESTLNKDSDGAPYITTIISLNTTNIDDTVRNSRKLKSEPNIMKQEVSNWKELFEQLEKQQNMSEEISQSYVKGLIPPQAKLKTVIDEDTDGDGLIVLEDLQHLKDFDSNIASASDEKLEVNTFEKAPKPTHRPAVSSKIPGNTRSVTVATASIVGLAMILFLLTYAAIKWKQQRKLLHKKPSFCDERIPTPVFESRKGHKNNCSTRSISPMLASSNIYTLNTLESHNGKESPDYVWDSLRKPFQ